MLSERHLDEEDEKQTNTTETEAERPLSPFLIDFMTGGNHVKYLALFSHYTSVF